MVNKKKIDEFNEEDLFDDCPICQAMKAAKKEDRELTEAELNGLKTDKISNYQKERSLFLVVGFKNKKLIKK